MVLRKWLGLLLSCLLVKTLYKSCLVLGKKREWEEVKKGKREIKEERNCREREK